MVKEKAPKLQANVAPVAPLATSYGVQVKRKRPSSAPAERVSRRLKKAWRGTGKGVSLREYARKHEMGKVWMANKKAYR